MPSECLDGFILSLCKVVNFQKVIHLPKRYWNKFLEYISSSIKEGKTFIIVIVIFNLTTAINSFFFYQKTWDIFRYFLTNALKVAFLVVILNLLISLIRPEVISTFLKILLTILSFSLFVVDVFCLYQYHTLLNYGILEILLATNPNEAAEFIEMYVLRLPILYLLLLILIATFGTYKIVGEFILKNPKVVAIIFIISAIISLSSLVKNLENFISASLSINRVALMLPKVFDDLNSYQELSQKAEHKVALTKDESDIPLVVFIVGESTGRNHMQIYGYNLPTTPHFVERANNDEIYIFNDIVSPNSHTMPVLLKLFTFYRNGAPGEWFEYINLFSILRAANYHTEWVSNQESSGIFGNVGKLYAKSCDISKFTVIRDTMDDRNTDGFYSDELLLPLFDESLSKDYKKCFYVLHMLGTHGKYSQRYPKDFSKFSAEDESGANEEIKQTRAEYDNAVLFNDHVVNEIIKRLESKNAIVIYISDHGDDVYDERDFAGHEEANGSRFMIEIPMIIWTSKQFKVAYPELEKNFNDSLNKPFMTDDMIHLILDILKIETEDYDPVKSLINDNYDESRERVYSGHVYDKEHGLK